MSVARHVFPALAAAVFFAAADAQALFGGISKAETEGAVATVDDQAEKCLGDMKELGKASVKISEVRAEFQDAVKRVESIQKESSNLETALNVQLSKLDEGEFYELEKQNYKLRSEFEELVTNRLETLRGSREVAVKSYREFRESILANRKVAYNACWLGRRKIEVAKRRFDERFGEVDASLESLSGKISSDSDFSDFEKRLREATKIIEDSAARCVGYISDIRTKFKLPKREGDTLNFYGGGGVLATNTTIIISNGVERVFTVQFMNADGTEYKTVTIKENENRPIAKIADTPTAPDYCEFEFWTEDRGTGAEFKGWGEAKFGEGMLAGRDSITLWPVFREIPVKVRFFSDETCAGLVKELSLKRSERATLTPDDLPDYTVPWGKEHEYWRVRGKEEMFVLATRIDGNLDLCPKFRDARFQVERFDFDLKGNAIPFGEALSLSLGDAIPGELPMTEGFDYLGWGVAADGKASEKDIVPVKGRTLGDNLSEPAKSLRLYAVRREKEFSAMFVGRDGAVVGVATGSVRRAVSAPAAPDVAGYAFSGWFANGSKFKNGTLSANVRAVAEYEAREYTATFIFRGEEVAKVRFSAVNPLSTDAVKPPEAEDWVFGSWSLDPKKTVEPPVGFAPGDVTFYAIGRRDEIPYEFWSFELCVEKGRIEVGGILEPPVLVDEAGNEVRPLGWADFTNSEEFFDFSQPITREHKPRIFGRLQARWPEELFSDKPRFVTKAAWEAARNAK